MALAPPTPAPAPSERPSLLQRIFVDHWELWLVLALTAFAAVLRLWHLTTLPYGFHGDEANVSLDAERITKHGWIGPWSNLSLGYPIAVNYYMAAFVKFMGVGSSFELWDNAAYEAREAELIAGGRPEAVRNIVIR